MDIQKLDQDYKSSTHTKAIIQDTTKTLLTPFKVPDSITDSDPGTYFTSKAAEAWTLEQYSQWNIHFPYKSQAIEPQAL